MNVILYLVSPSRPSLTYLSPHFSVHATLQSVCIPDKDPNHKWPEAKFQTVCWFLTLHMHHVALIPALHTHQRRIR